MLRKTVFASGETYHIYNRGAHKQNIFYNEPDYQRFLLGLFLMNGSSPVHISNILSKYQGRSLLTVFEEEQITEKLVDILAYALMPNHFHIVLRQKEEGGITKFCKKALTAYSMYFNAKYDHSGVLFQGRFKSSHIDNDAYFRWIFSYVHLNPLSLVEPGWEEKGVSDIAKARSFIRSYKPSSYFDYFCSKRQESSILSTENMPTFLNTQNDLEDLLASFIKDRP